MKTLTQQINKSEGRRKMRNLLLLGIVVSFVLYGFAIASTTLSIADADTHNREINELQTEIAELEIEYFDMINNLSIDEASMFGLNEVNSVRYARIDEAKAVAYNL